MSKRDRLDADTANAHTGHEIATVDNVDDTMRRHTVHREERLVAGPRAERVQDVGRCWRPK